MAGWIPFLAVNSAGLAAFAIAWLVARRGPRSAALVAGAALVLLIAKAVLTWLPVWEAACFPFGWYIYLQSYWSPLIGLAFFGLAIPQLPVAWNRVVVALIAVAVFAFGAQRTWWMVSRPTLGDGRTPDAVHHLSQSTGYTCAPCAAAIAVSYVGIQVSERTMADRCLTIADQGTTPFNTYRGLILTLDGSPWRARMAYVAPATLCESGRVAVIDFPDIRHAITTVGDGRGVTLHDPLMHKPSTLSQDDLAERYGGTAILIESR